MIRNQEGNHAAGSKSPTFSGVCFGSASKEVGYFIPAITEATDKRCIRVDRQQRCKVAIQSNNIETDDRGYIYVVDRANTGLHILELTGEARAAAGLQ